MKTDHGELSDPLLHLASPLGYTRKILRLYIPGGGGTALYPLTPGGAPLGGGGGAPPCGAFGGGDAAPGAC